MFDELTGNPVHENPVQQEQAPVAEQPRPQEAPKENNLRIMRERAEAAERRNLELERMIQMNMNQNQQSTKIQLVEEDDDFGISDDSYIEGKHLKKYVKTLKQELKATKKQFEEMHQSNAMANAEIRLKSQFSDFDAVVSPENVERLKTLKPALYRSIMANSDIYDRGYTAYELIKNSSMIAESYPEQDRKIEENRARPRSSSTAAPQVAETPLSRVGDYDRRILTKQRKEEILRNMEEAKRNR